MPFLYHCRDTLFTELYTVRNGHNTGERGKRWCRCYMPRKVANGTMHDSPPRKLCSQNYRGRSSIKLTGSCSIAAGQR